MILAPQTEGDISINTHESFSDHLNLTNVASVVQLRKLVTNEHYCSLSAIAPMPTRNLGTGTIFV